MKRKSLIIAISLLCFSASAAYGDDAVKRAKIEEFFKLAKMDETLSQTLQAMSDQVKAAMARQMASVKPPPEMEKLSSEFQEKLFALLFDAMTWEKLKPAYLKLYADAFSEEQIDDILAFYKSPGGQALVEKTPLLMRDAMAVAQERLAEAEPQMQQLLKDFTAQVRAVSEQKKK